MGIFDFLKKKEDEKPVSSERPAYDKASLEEFKAQLNKAKEEQGDWKTPYTELMKAVYEQPVLFFALSREQYDKENNTSVPLISTKDFGGVNTDEEVMKLAGIARNTYYKYKRELKAEVQ